MKKISKFKLGQKHPVWKKKFFQCSCSADIVECQILLKKRMLFSDIPLCHNCVIGHVAVENQF